MKYKYGLSKHKNKPKSETEHFCFSNDHSTVNRIMHRARVFSGKT